MLTLAANTLVAAQNPSASNRHPDAIQAVIDGKKLLDQGTADSARQAIVKFEQAAKIMREDKDASGEANALAGIADIYNSLGENQHALDYLNRAIPLMRATGDRRGSALLLALAGTIQSSSGEKRKAIESYNAALPIFRELRERNLEASTLNNLGIVLSDLGNAAAAMAAYQEALKIRKEINDEEGQAQVLGNIGIAYSQHGEFQKSLEVYALSLPVIEKGKDRQAEARLLINIGIAHKLLGDKLKAMDFLSRALSLGKRIGDKFSQEGALTNIGAIYNESDENTKVIDSYEQALAIERESNDWMAESHTLVNLGIAYRESGNLDKAMDAYNQALTLMRRREDKTGEAYTLSAIGSLVAKRGESQKAQSIFEESLALFRTTENVPMQASTLRNLAQIQRDRGDLQSAKRRIEFSLTLIESMRGRYTNEDFQTKFFATVQDHYDFYIDLLMRLHKQQPDVGYNGAAVAASERARARSLLDLLVEARAEIRLGGDPQLLEQERSLRESVNTRSEARMRMMRRPHTAAEALAVAKEIDLLTIAYQQAQANIRKTSPRYAALTQPRPLTLKEIQAHLDSETLVLYYSLGGEHSYLSLISSTEVKSFELPARKEIEGVARNFYELLSVVTDAKHKEMLDAASRLSQMLLGPVAGQLGEKRLAIVADGALQYLPFAALPDPAASKQSPNGGQPLIVRHEIVSLASISVLATIRNETSGRRPSPKDIVVLADPVFYKDDTRVKANTALRRSREKKTSVSELTARPATISGSSGPTRGGDLDSLPASRKEAEGIVIFGRQDKTRKALDFEASRELAVSGDLSQYRYVHFATHGLVDSVHPELTTIVLSLVDENGNPRDGYLRAHDIYNLNLPADLVVLSACETALGKDVKGEGLISLTRAFMYAGAPRVVASLWAVRDDSTAKLMAAFYRHMIKEGKRPAEALRAAQIELMKSEQWRAPHYWAPFVLQGEWR